jgi:esterase/lipase
MGLVNESIMKFVHRYMDDTNMREKVYQVWTTMRKFTPRLSEIKSSIRKNNTPVYLIFGKYDRIIVPEFGETFVKNMEQWCKMEILEAGHQLLHPRYADAIAEALTFCSKNQHIQSV